MKSEPWPCPPVPSCLYLQSTFPCIFTSQMQLHRSSAVLSTNKKVFLFPPQLKDLCITAYPSHSSKSREKYAVITCSVTLMGFFTIIQLWDTETDALVTRSYLLSLILKKKTPSNKNSGFFQCKILCKVDYSIQN